MTILKHFLIHCAIFFADIPYDLQINKEKYYQTVFYLIFSLIGLKVEAEVKINKGRIDAVIIDKDIYIFEFTDRNVGEWIVEKLS